MTEQTSVHRRSSRKHGGRRCVHVVQHTARRADRRRTADAGTVGAVSDHSRAWPNARPGVRLDQDQRGDRGLQQRLGETLVTRLGGRGVRARLEKRNSYNRRYPMIGSSRHAR